MDTELFSDYWYELTFSNDLKNNFENIIYDFLSKINIEDFSNFPNKIKYKKTSEYLNIKDFLEKEYIDSYLKIKFSSLYCNINNKFDNSFFINNSDLNQNNWIFWNIDKRMSKNEKKLCNDTIHSELNLISTFNNNIVNNLNINKTDLYFITSARPCINCAYSISTFNKKIKNDWFNWIKYILLWKNELCVDDNFSKDNIYTSSNFLKTLKILLDSEIRVFSYTLKWYENKTCDFKLFFEILLWRIVINENNNYKLYKKINEIRDIKDFISIKEYSYQHIEEFDEIMRNNYN